MATPIFLIRNVQSGQIIAAFTTREDAHTCIERMGLRDRCLVLPLMLDSSLDEWETHPQMFTEAPRS